VGAGNVAVIVDGDGSRRARTRRALKTFDNATSCSSENSVAIA
jgi:hypothetical protein